MSANSLSGSELLVLGLIAEMPRHGYELEQIIEQRGMREWAQIGFSSIYFVLGKLERKKMIKAERPASEKAKKRYRLSKIGETTLVSQTFAAIENVRPTYPALLTGMIHWSVLTRTQALSALASRKDAVATELERLENVHFQQQPLPDHVDAIFYYSINQLKAEAQWITTTLDYMETKPWNT